MKEQTIALAESLGWNIYKDGDDTCTIEVPGKNPKLLLKTEEFDGWLLMSNQAPQIILKPAEASKFVEEINKRLLR